MTIYKTNTKNFNEKVVAYLEKIKIEEKRRYGRYDFVNSIEKGGIIQCFTSEERDSKDFVFINLAGCPETVENKLKILTNY